jgi:hypothetical protein
MRSLYFARMRSASALRFSVCTRKSVSANGSSRPAVAERWVTPHNKAGPRQVGAGRTGAEDLGGERWARSAPD